MMVKNKSLISIIVPVYNVEKYVKKCILSLVRQTYKNIEILIIDDGTKDKSIDIIRNIKDKRIRIIHQKNGGVSSARNNGLEHAKGEYIVFVDSDDFVAKDYIEYLYSLITLKDSDFAYSTNMFLSKNDKQIVNDSVEVVNGMKSAGIILSPDVVVGSCNKIYKRKVIDENKLRFRTDLFYGEGLNFIIRMSLVSKSVVVGNRKILYYRKNNMSSATTKYDIHKINNGEKSLKIVADMIDMDDDYVRAMYVLHLSMFYCGAIANTIEKKEVNHYKDNYVAWRQYLKSNKIFILKNKYISRYRKLIVIGTIYFPHVISFMNLKRNQRKIKCSV